MQSLGVECLPLDQRALKGSWPLQRLPLFTELCFLALAVFEALSRLVPVRFLLCLKARQVELLTLIGTFLAEMGNI